MLTSRILSQYIGYFVLSGLAFLSLVGCASYHVYPTAPLEYQLPSPSDSPLALYLTKLPQINDQTGVYPLGDGVDAFVARLALIDAARVSIDLQYYLYHDDETGKLLTLYLYRAAERGVRVRLLLDDMATKGKDQQLFRLVQHPNISVRIFNPDLERQFRTLSFAQNFSRLNHRMHNKSFTVDNLVSIVGGRNIGDEYYSAHRSVEFGDLDMLLIGQLIPEVSNQFDLYWNASQVQPIEQLLGKKIEFDDVANVREQLDSYELSVKEHPYLLRLIQSQLLSRIIEQQIGWFWSSSELFYDPPNKLNTAVNHTLLLDDLSTFFNRTKNELIIISPYFVPTNAGTDALINAVKNGLKVTIITNTLAATDVLAVHAGYINYRERLIDGGVLIYEMKSSPEWQKDKSQSQWKGSSRSSLHAKLFIIDRKMMFVGSFNFDPRSAWLNTEMGVIVEQQALTTLIAEDVLSQLNVNAYQVIKKEGQIQWLDLQHQTYLTTEPDSSWWQRFTANALSWLPVESQL